MQCKLGGSDSLSSVQVFSPENYNHDIQWASMHIFWNCFNVVFIIYPLQAKKLTPEEAYQYIKSRRPHILLAPRQWEAIKVFHKNLSQDDRYETYNS